MSDREDENNRNELRRVRDTEYFLSKRLANLERFRTSSPQKFNKEQHTEETRSKIAISFTESYLAIFALFIFFVPIFNLTVVYLGSNVPLLGYDDFMSVFGIISSAFGFVLGHYFGSKSDN